MTNFDAILYDLKRGNSYRSLSLPYGIDLSSNDYLGMAQDPFLKKVAIDALSGEMDVGAAGSRLLRGHAQEHQDLEVFTAQYFSAPLSLYFSSGFQANYAILSTLPQRGDVILFDSYIHASMREGMRSSYAKSYKFLHNNLQSLEELLKRYNATAKIIWIAVETLYSMDGDFAPIEDILKLARKYGAYLIADEAHATGIYGESGRGVMYEAAKALEYDRVVTIHTCGKAIGIAGGLVCASKDIVEYLINAARPFIYSTAPMPLQALLVRKSLEFLATQEGQKRREKLLSLCQVGYDIFGGNGTQIIPYIVGENEKAVKLALYLQSKGFDVRAVRPPTVPKNTARLRISLSTNLEKDVLQSFGNVLKSFS